MGFSIVIMTARNMRTFDGNIGKINIHTLPVIIDWLNENNIPYDEVIVGSHGAVIRDFMLMIGH